MSAWMEYVYMQKPRPTNVTGVPVELYVLDANGNYRMIGTTTADGDGFFSYSWTPDIEGKYTVYTSFAGSKAYWSSRAVTSFAVDPPPATPTPTESSPSMADLYFVPATVVIIIAVIVVGLVTILLMLNKKP